MINILFLVPEIDANNLKISYINKLESKIDNIYAEIVPVTKTVSICRDNFKQIQEKYKDYNVSYICICISSYYTALTGLTKPLRDIGYILNINNSNIVYLPFYKDVFFLYNALGYIDISLKAIDHHIKGTYIEPGSNIINYAYYPNTKEEIKEWLNKLLNKEALTIDIETYSLKHPTSGIKSITFCWDKHEGIAFIVDKSLDNKNIEVRQLLKDFFLHYKGKAIYHNIAFDVYILIYQLFMNDLLDYKGLLYGLDIMLKNWDDTKLLTYLCTNNCICNKLSLKDQSQEYSGNYALDEIDNISEIADDTLLKYNLIDGLSTWYVYEKYNTQLDREDQRNIYNNIFKPATKDIIQMQLVGLPLDPERVLEVEQILLKDRDNALGNLINSQLIKDFIFIVKEEWVESKNKTLKTKRVTIDDCKEEFNPSSNKQLQKLLYEFFKLPIINKTVKNNPATDGSTIKALINHTDDPEIKVILQSLLDYSAVAKILDAFIPAFKKAYKAKDGRAYLFGNFHLGGTVSGRLSSSKINLQQLPATGSKYAKLIKSCFKAPEGWILVGLDFHSLEDYISALTTKDPNKILIYEDGYDSHSFRANFYYKEQMPDISLAEPEEECYKVELDSGVEYIHEKEVINYLGKNITGKELYKILH